MTRPARGSTLAFPVQITLKSDSFGRVVGTIADHGAQATVSASDGFSAVTDLRLAVESATSHGIGECFWHEALGDYRWLFRREGGTMRLAIVRSTGTLTGWEHCFWSECDVEEFRKAMREALDAFCVSS
jgi:hypothetical protein